VNTFEGTTDLQPLHLGYSLDLTRSVSIA